MRHQAISIRGLAVACGLLASASVAQAAPETRVSGTGTDAGNCPITAPCRTFAFAHTQTNNNGAINVLTSGNFGPLTITKPISIVADGVEAVINTGAGGAAIIVQASGAAVVSLRGLTIDLRGTNNRGISFVSGGALRVQNCVIRKSDIGIFFEPASGTPELHVADSVIANAVTNGILVPPTGSAGVTATLIRVRVENTVQEAAIEFSASATTGAIMATVRDSVVTGNGQQGIVVGGGTASAMIHRSAFVNNTTAIVASGTGVIRMGDSTVTGNEFGFFPFIGGTIESYGTNKVDGNGADGAPTSTIAMK